MIFSKYFDSHNFPKESYQFRIKRLIDSVERFTEKNEYFENFNDHEPTTHFDLCGKE